MAESRNLNSGFLHTSFVDFDFTVAKIITILPTGYRAQLIYASYCRRKPIDQVRVTIHFSVRQACGRHCHELRFPSQAAFFEGVLLSAVARKTFRGGSKPIPERSVYCELYEPSCAVLLDVAVDLPAILLICCGPLALTTPLSIPKILCAGLRRALCSFRVVLERYSVPVPATSRNSQFYLSDKIDDAL